MWPHFHEIVNYEVQAASSADIRITFLHPVQFLPLTDDIHFLPSQVLPAICPQRSIEKFYCTSWFKKGYTSSLGASILYLWHFHALESQAVEFQGGACKATRTEMPRIATRTKLQEEVTSNLTHLSTSSSTSIIFTSNMGTNLLQTKLVNMI